MVNFILGERTEQDIALLRRIANCFEISRIKLQHWADAASICFSEPHLLLEIKVHDDCETPVSAGFSTASPKESLFIERNCLRVQWWSWEAKDARTSLYVLYTGTKIVYKTDISS